MTSSVISFPACWHHACSPSQRTEEEGFTKNAAGMIEGRRKEAHQNHQSLETQAETGKASPGLEMFKTRVQTHHWAGTEAAAWPRGCGSCESRMNTAGLPLEAFSSQAWLGSSQSVHRGNGQEWAWMSKSSRNGHVQPHTCCAPFPLLPPDVPGFSNFLSPLKRPITPLATHRPPLLQEFACR